MRKPSGQALVEFIIIVPILLLILMGIVDFGNIIYQKYRLEGSLDTLEPAIWCSQSRVYKYLTGFPFSTSWSR